MVSKQKNEIPNEQILGAIEHIRIECDHFYQAELACEQRGSWILTMNGVLIVALLSVMATTELRMACCRNWMLSGTYLVAFFTVFMSFVASLRVIQPLRGRDGVAWKGKQATCGDNEEVWSLDLARITNTVETSWKHLLRHRRRAELRGGLVLD